MKTRTVRYGNCRVTVKRDAAWNEWKINTYIGNKLVADAFESDRTSARGTAAAQVRWLRKHRRAACAR